ncbi:hypothetical protein GALMADRAFT_73674 [Galerina marginata CBS 339.88]|uniref:Transmembrane protein n=1 Tax=Galerina marginata (strain CBS 339.88) TaxID=685588 RepID=A0A067SNM6_GALM3|nr:hypothetical protein GALMADRAFT_73674 [Galerina marginata CBS 339.88]
MKYLDAPPTPIGEPHKTWVPMPLRPYFWIPLIIFLIGGAIGLEVALHFSNKNQGWPSKQTDNGFIALHYVYVVALWTWTDIEIKKIQQFPGMDSSGVQPTLSRCPCFFDGNFELELSTAGCCFARCEGYMDPAFLTGAGYAGASVLYDLPAPAFIQIPYTIANFELPLSVTNNGTAFVNTTAIKSETGCQAVPVQMTLTAPGAWSNTASLNGCSITWAVSNSTTDTLFGADTPTCDSAPPPQFNPVVFWFFSYASPARASATFCYPTISLWEVNAGVDISTGNVTKVSEIRPFSQDSKFSSFSANVTGAPLNGRAYNGIKFNLTAPDQFVLGRQNATQLQLPASIYQAALKSPQGYVGSFDANTFTTLSNEVYGIYLALVAREVYFLPDTEDINVQVKTFQKRVWLSDVAAHLLAAAMFILAFFGTIVHLFHIEDRRYLSLKHEPGTIASAVSIGAQTGVGQVLAGRQGEGDLKEALRNRKFRIDPVTMKIIMEGEYGYETAAVPTSPMSRRKSILEILQGQRQGRTLNRSPPGTNAPPSPKTPKTPKTPTNPQSA